jgi:DNA-binding IclR family transcriptional regulator
VGTNDIIASILDSCRRPYRLWLAPVTLADRVISRLDLRSLARPVLVELEESTGETATLSLPGAREVDVNAIATPVFDRSGELAAILGLQGPASRLEDPTRLLTTLLAAAARLTRALGGRPQAPVAPA